MADGIDDTSANDVPRLRRLRYIFTVVMKSVPLPDDPLAQKIFLDAALQRLKEAVDPDRIGVLGIMEEESVI